MSVAAGAACAQQSYRAGLVLVLLGSVCASWIGLGVRMMEAAGAWQILFYRSVGLVVFLLVYLALRYAADLGSVFRQAGVAALVGGVGLAVAFAGSLVAIEQASVANAMFVLAAGPFFAALLGWAVLSEGVRLATWLAIALAFTGVVIMVIDGMSFGYLWGNVAALMAACGLAVFVVALRWGRVGDMLPLNVFAGILAALVALGVCMLDGVGIRVSLHDTLLGLAMGVFQLGIALVLITRGSRSVPAAELSLLNMAEVVLAPLWVWLVLGETAGIYTLLGGAMVLGAIYLDAVTGLRRRRLANAG